MKQSNNRNILKIMQRRPAVHRLTCGAFIQEYIWLDKRTFIVPLQPMGFYHGTNYAENYHSKIFGFQPSTEAISTLQEQGKDALPVIAFIYFPSIKGTPEEMEKIAQPKLEHAEQLIGWLTGDYLNDFAYLVATSDDYYFRVVPPHTRRRIRLGPGNVGEVLKNNMKAMSKAVENDERFAFALSLYRDSLHETDKHFKIARLFSVLEALAYALKTKKIGSRNAIRIMLGLKNGAVDVIKYRGRTIRYERIELSGRLRDKLFHGAQFRREDLTVEWRDSFDLLTEQPEVLIDSLMSACEIEFMKWVNKTSKAQKATQKKSNLE